MSSTDNWKFASLIELGFSVIVASICMKLKKPTAHLVLPKAMALNSASISDLFEGLKT